MATDTEKFLVYNGYDILATQTVRDKLAPELEEHPNEEIYDWTIRLFGPLIFMMTRGMKVDHDRLKNTKREVEGKMDELLSEIHEICGRSINPSSSQDCQKYFYVEKNIPPYTKRNTKGQTTITCDDKALQRLARGTSQRKPLREAALMQQYRRLRKLSTSYLNITFDKDNRLRCFYKPRGSRFSRLSSSKTVFGTGMNMQNLPDEFKDFLVPDDGYVLIEIDKSQAEWVVMAYVCGDASMIKVLEEGKDPHTYTAQQMFNLPEELIKMEAKLVGHSTDPAEIKKLRHRLVDLRNYKGWLIQNMSLRQAGKKSNHGLNYDEGPNTFALINGILQGEAKKIIANYHRIYPGIRRYYEKVKQQLARDRTLVNCYGRSYTFMEKWGDELFKAAYSFVPQSTIGDLTNRGLIYCYEDPEIPDVELLGQVHDSILVQVPLSIGPTRIIQAIKRIEDHMNPTLPASGREFTIPTDLKMGTISWRQLEEVPLNEPDIRRHVLTLIEEQDGKEQH